MENEASIWERYLSCNRINDILNDKKEKACDTEVRNPYERDCDRITYSYPFRRLQDKTQVIPLPTLDFVHTRLTHSLEVATVGRSFGRMLENHLLLKGIIKDEKRGDIPAIMTAACLAHDIGNPPFGHSGENSISEYFRFGDGVENLKKMIQFNPYQPIDCAKYFDFCKFEGNAMGFRTLVKYNEVGLNLTCATLGAFSKYPRPSYILGEEDGNRWNSDRVSQKKYGFFHSEKEIFHLVAKELGLKELKNDKGLIAYSRHPLSFLMEAADDICYRIIDLEDGFRLERIPFYEAEKCLCEIAQKDERYELKTYQKIPTEKMKFSYLRAKAINYLVVQSFQVFIDNYHEILKGDFDKELLDSISDNETRKATTKIKSLVKKYVYEWRDVLTLEATGFEVLSGLTAEFIGAVNKCFNCDPANTSFRSQKIWQLLPETYRHNDDDQDYYDRYMNITTYVSGMTDKYALTLFRKIKGIQL